MKLVQRVILVTPVKQVLKVKGVIPVNKDLLVPPEKGDIQVPLV